MKLKKLGLGLNVLALPLVPVTMIISCTDKNKKSELTKSINLGFKSSLNSEKPKALGKSPTKSQIDSYNAQMAAHNADQVKQQNKAKSNLVQAKDLNYLATQGKKKPKALGKNPTKSQIDSYNAQMTVHNADQASQQSKAESNLVQAKDLGYATTKENEKPKALGKNPTKSQIDSYNAQMAAHNADQANQQSKAESNLVQAKDLGYATTKENEKPKALGKNPTKSQIDLYNAKMDVYNANQFKQRNGKDLSISKANDFGFPITVGKEKPRALVMENPTKSQIDSYNAQMAAHNADQASQQSKAKSSIVKAIDLGSVITTGKGKPNELVENPTKSQIDSYNAQMKVYNADQTKALVQPKDLGFPSTEGNEKPVVLISSSTKEQSIAKYVEQMNKYNADQANTKRLLNKAVEILKSINVSEEDKELGLSPFLVGETSELGLPRILSFLDMNLTETEFEWFINNLSLSKPPIDGKAFLQLGTNTFTIKTLTQSTRKKYLLKIGIRAKKDEIKKALSGSMKKITIDKIKKVLSENLDENLYNQINELELVSKDGNTGNITVSWRNNTKIKIPTSALNDV